MSNLNFEAESFAAFPSTDDTFDAHEHTPTNLRMRADSIRARILWPALGFPAVVGPGAKGATDPFATDSSRCICLLVVSNKQYLGKEDVAQYLRIVPWSDRVRRQISSGQAGSFSPTELGVRNNANDQLMRSVSDTHGDAVVFGGAGTDSTDPVVVSLSREVRKFYADHGLKFLHEIRVTESASARFRDGLYQLFWNNDAGENQSSDEMQLLIEKFARPRRRKLGAMWNDWQNFFLDEYRFDYGALHPPYRQSDPQKRFTEVLHPVFIKHASGPLRLGHVTDTHVHVRDDAYQANLDKNSATFPGLVYNNFNKSFVGVYSDAKKDSDAILLTGDLIDYGRGHVGPGFKGEFLDTLGEDEYYHEDRNWFLFYYLLASGGNYTVPTYTSLGNHDWRLNPYPPFAPGHPASGDLIHNADAFTSQQLDDIVRTAHGRGNDRGYAYSLNIDEGKVPVKQIVKAVVLHDYDTPGSPLQTTVESVLWYLLLINPFLDYQVKLPGGQQLLMIDWGEKEKVEHEDAPYTATSAGPQAEKCLTKLQQWHVKEFLDRSGNAKIVGMHSPPLGPFPQWSDSDLKQGVKRYRSGENSRHRGADYQIRQYPEHSLFAIRPHDQPYGTAADYGSFLNGRDEFIQQIADARRGVRLIFTGHIHRNGLFTASAPTKSRKAWMLRDVSAANVSGVRWPAVATNGATRETFLGPLYVNTTSTGPRGNLWLSSGHVAVNPGWTLTGIASDGTITGVSRRQLLVAQGATPRTPAPTHEFENFLSGSGMPQAPHAFPNPAFRGASMNSDLNFEAEAFSAYQPQSENEQFEQEHHFVHGGHFGGGHMFRGGRRGFRRGSWWRRNQLGSGDSTQDSQSIGWAQNCLAQITGGQLSQSGRMGHSTRRAIRRFQQQQQLPPTGRLDSGTMAALQQACGNDDSGGGSGDQGDGDNEARFSGYEFDQQPLPTAPAPVYTPRNCNSDKLPVPSGAQRALTAGRVQCPTRANAQRLLAPVIKKAVDMLDHTIAELTHARDAACRGEPLGWPNLREVTACWLKYKLGVCIDDPAAWTAGTFDSRSVAEVIRRLVRPRDLLASNEIVYVCEATCDSNTTFAFTTVRQVGTDGVVRCIPGAPDRRIHLCPAFWDASHAPFREETIIHETVHLTHCAGGTEDTNRGVSIGSPECLAQFVLATNLQDLDPLFVDRCGFTNRCGTVPKQQFGRNCGAKAGPSPKPLPDWRP